MSVADCRTGSSALARERNAVILAHNYERPEVQDVADFVGDSLGSLARGGEDARGRDRVLRCAFHGRDGGDSVAATRRVLLAGPGGGLLAGGDHRCRPAPRVEGRASGCRRGVVRQHDRRGEGGERLLLHVGQRRRCGQRDAGATGRSCSCPTSSWARTSGGSPGARTCTSGWASATCTPGSIAEDIARQRAAHPEAEFLIHPECGCATSVVDAVSAGAIDGAGVQILSTEGMIRRPAASPADEFIVATEVGILHRLRRENPAKTFYPANERAVCAYMKVTTLPKVVAALERLQHESRCRRTWPRALVWRSSAWLRSAATPAARTRGCLRAGTGRRPGE